MNTFRFVSNVVIFIVSPGSVNIILIGFGLVGAQQKEPARTNDAREAEAARSRNATRGVILSIFLGEKFIFKTS